MSEESEAAVVAPQGIGLAMSGGGFRAAFFHLGVLRRLDEAGLLPQVKVLSCVSGGSFAGAVYYLALVQRLLPPGATFPPGGPPELDDRDLLAADYTAAVATSRDVLTDLARKNLRATVFRNPLKNATMFLSPVYSRTDRGGDMLDLHLRTSFGFDTGLRYGRLPRQIELRGVHFVRDDLPRLVLNATTLNTGHAWRFDTDGMGELLSPSRRVVDKNALLRWTSFAELAAQGSAQQDFPLALAVAASAAFPGLFRPLPLSGLYDRRVDLMDGGAQDNQGVQSLVGERPPSISAVQFDRMIVSDGAGQLKDERTKRRSLIGVGRIIGIQGDRIREEQLLAGKARFEEIGGRFDVLDLRHAVPYDDVPAAGPSATAPPGPELRMRERLAEVRTDLDAFGELETTLLERRGYEVAAHVLSPDDPLADGLPASNGTLRLLGVASKQMLKPLHWARLGFLQLAALAALVAAGALAIGQLPPDADWRIALRGVILAVFLALPTLLTRAFRPGLEGAPRWVFWGGAGLMYGLLVLGAWRAGPEIDDWGAASWTGRESVAWAVVLLLLPALLPTVLWLVLWLEGRLWRVLARMPAG